MADRKQPTPAPTNQRRPAPPPAPPAKRFEYPVSGGESLICPGPNVPGSERHLSYVVTTEDAKILAEEIEARADTLELVARTGAPARGCQYDLVELGKRSRLLRREAARLRGQHA